MGNNTWVKLYRKILDNPVVMKDAETLAIWVYLLLNASYKEHKVLLKNETLILNPGQLITGSLKIAKDLNINRNKVQRTLRLLENEQQLEQQVSNKGRLITIVNWENYQGLEELSEQQVSNKRATSEQRVRTTKESKNNSSYYYLENKYARTINSTEYIYLNKLEEIYDLDLIKKAIDISCLNNAKRLTYVEGILKNWKSENINSLGDLVEIEKSKEDESYKELFEYDWLNDNEE